MLQSAYVRVAIKDSPIRSVGVLFDPLVLVAVFNQLIDRGAWSETGHELHDISLPSYWSVNIIS